MFPCEFCKIFKNAFLQSNFGGCLWKWCHHNLADHFKDCSKVPLNLDFHDYFWKLNLMSDICEVKSQISEYNLQSNVVHHSPYHMKWIWYSLHQALGIFFFLILHATSKVRLCCSIFSIKTFSKLVPSFGEVVGPFGNFFVSFLCLRLFNISSICSRDVFHPVKCKARDFFATAFHCCLLISQCFAVLLIVEIFTLVIVMSKAIVCIWKFFRLVVFSCLYRSRSIFYPELIRV